MKSKLSLLLALLLAFLFVFSGCANHGKTLIKAGREEISVNVFQLYLSRMKASLASAGYRVEDENFWRTQYERDSDATYADYYTNQVFEGLKHIAAAMIMYEEYGLSLDKATENSIDAWIDALIEEVGGGSKSMLNSQLADFGANITTLRDAAILEAKLSQLKAYLYGEGGSLIADSAKEEHYKATYYRGYQLLVANKYYKHDKDDNRDSIYYTDDTYKHIAYDTDGEGVIKTDRLDKYGDPVYIYAPKDGDAGVERIAYDREKGKIHYEVDEKTNERVLEEYTEGEMLLRQQSALEIAEKCKGNEALFLKCMEQYSDNSQFHTDMAPNGMYFSFENYATDDIFGTMAAELAKLEVGELSVLTSDSGYYVLMRFELDEGAWKTEVNSRWFETLAGLTLEYKLQQRTATYLDRLKINEELRSTVDITMVEKNNYY